MWDKATAIKYEFTSSLLPWDANTYYETIC